MRILLLLVLALLTSCAQVSRPSFPARQARHVGESTIEFSPGDESYADLLAAKLANRAAAPATTADKAPFTVADLPIARDRLLARVAEFIGLDQPTEKMRDVYDSFARMHAELAAGFGPVRRFALWQRTEVIARLKAGEKIQGFKLGGPTGLDFSFGFNVEYTDDKKTTPSAPEMVWPISIRTPDKKTPEQEIDEGLETMEEMRHAMTQGEVTTLWPFLVLHEATEVGEVTNYIESRDRRWFCDGVANYVAMKIIAGEVGVDQAKRYYDLPAQLARYAGVAARVDLEKWPAAENMAKANYAEDLSTADYAYATKVLADICAKHGDALLPKLFREIGRTKKEQTTMQTVYAAFRKLTGEDMKSYLPGRRGTKRE